MLLEFAGWEVAQGDEGTERGDQRDDDRRARHCVDECFTSRVRDALACLNGGAE